MSFPEEPLDLPTHEGGGYFEAQIGGVLNGGRLQVVRKLGWGPRSSVWLVWDTADEAYYGVKVYTLAASPQADIVELPILRKAAGVTDFTLWLPGFQRRFWEKANNGSHLCVVSNPYSTSILTMQRDAEGGRLPVNVVQRVILNVAEAVKALNDAGIMYGAIKPENLLFFPGYETEDIKSILESEPRPTTMKVKKYSTVRSQPLPHTFQYEGKNANIVHWKMSLVGFGHASRLTHQPAKDYDYCSAPETLLNDASCSELTDAWMLGCLAFYLLTGTSPFHPKRTVAKAIAHMSGVLGDDDGPDAIPEAWLADRNMKDYAAAAAGRGDHSYVITVEAALADYLEEEEVKSASDFIRGCLRLDPEKRMTVAEASTHEWVKKANPCSCGFSGC